MCNKKVCPICNGERKVDVTPELRRTELVRTDDAGEECIVDGKKVKSLGIAFYREYEQCWACKGSGEVLETEERCPECHGYGRVTPNHFVFDGNGREGIDCPKCKGRGVK